MGSHSITHFYGETLYKYIGNNNSKNKNHNNQSFLEKKSYYDSIKYGISYGYMGRFIDYFWSEIESRLSEKDRSKEFDILMEKIREISEARFPVLCQLPDDTNFALFAKSEPKHEAPALPTEPPALWAEKKLPDDTPPDFIKRYYGQWLDGTLTTADIRQLDSKLHRAYYNWKRDNPLPKGFHLPTRKEQNDTWIQRIESGEFSGERKDIERLGAAVRYRKNNVHR